MDESSTREVGPSRAGRAIRAFWILGIITLVATLAGLLGPGDQSSVERLVRLAPGVLWLVALFAGAAAITWRRPWAIASLPVVLAVLILGGIASLLVAVSEGRLLIPFSLLLGIWVLGAPSRATDGPTVGIRTLGLTAAFVLASAGPWLADVALAPGGPLIVGRADIAPTLTVDCGPEGRGMPATLNARVDWSWRRTEPLVDSTDMVAVGWAGEDEAGTDLFILGDTTGSTGQPGIWQGGGSPSYALAQDFVNRFHGFNSWTWGVSLGEQRMAPGYVPFTMLRVSSVPPAHGQLTVQAAYVHLGKWMNKDATASCTW